MSQRDEPTDCSPQVDSAKLHVTVVERYREDCELKVVFISGFWRSGTTLLARAIGELPGVFDAGELRLIWQYSFVGNGLCGCGQPFRRCAVWQEIVRHAFTGKDLIDAQFMLGKEPSARYTPLMLLPGASRLISRRFASYLEVLDHLYSAVARVSGSRIVVDSSKIPQYGFLLNLVPSIELYVVHVVRDPRGVQHSVLRRKRLKDPLGRHPTVATLSRRWDTFNLTQELFSTVSKTRHMRVRYEDFVSRPLETMQQLTNFIEEPNLRLPSFMNGCIALGLNHAISGNEGRFQTGQIPLRLDTRWAAEMSARERRIATRLTAPLRRHYGYPR